MKNAILAILTIIYVSCHSPENNSIWSSQDGCKLDRLEYQEINDTIQTMRNGNIETGVKANGKIIMTGKINVDTIGAYLHDGDKVFINQKTFKIVKVSQNFYEEFSKNRESLCQIVEGLKSGTISSEEGKKRAEGLYLDIVEMFSGLDKNKKNNDLNIKVINSPESNIIVGDSNKIIK